MPRILFFGGEDGGRLPRLHDFGVLKGVRIRGAEVWCHWWDTSIGPGVPLELAQLLNVTSMGELEATGKLMSICESRVRLEFPSSTVCFWSLPFSDGMV